MELLAVSTCVTSSRVDKRALTVPHKMKIVPVTRAVCKVIIISHQNWLWASWAISSLATSIYFPTIPHHSRDSSFLYAYLLATCYENIELFLKFFTPNYLLKLWDPNKHCSCYLPTHPAVCNAKDNATKQISGVVFLHPGIFDTSPTLKILHHTSRTIAI